MMDENKLPKRNMVLYVSIVVILICLTYRASYAYFTAKVINDGEPTQTVLNTGDLKLQFNNGVKYINATDMIITTAAEAETKDDNYSSFSVTNTGRSNATYKLYLTDYSITDNLVNEDFKYKLKIGSNTYTGNFYDLFKDQVPNESHIITSNSVDIPLNNVSSDIESGVTDNCELRVWLQEEDHNQISLTEGAFRGTVKLIAISK